LNKANSATSASKDRERAVSSDQFYTDSTRPSALR
jgi:hypothetical protein